MPWLIARYQPSSLFSLKQGDATSTGAKSLLLPTPFAVRMALLDAAIRTAGVAEGPRAFETIKALRLAVRPPAYAAVSSTFLKVLKPEREAEARGRAMTRTIAFREYVHLAGELAIAFGGPEDGLAAIRPWLMQISYFGKRGGSTSCLRCLNTLICLAIGCLRAFCPFQSESERAATLSLWVSYSGWTNGERR